MMTIFLIGAALLAAEPEPSGPLTLDAAVRLALANHPDAVAATARVDAASARVEQTLVSRRPQLDAQATAGVSGTEPPDFLGPNPTVRAGLSLGWLITDFGASQARTRAARVAVDSARTDITATQYVLIVAVEDAYFEVVARDGLVDVVNAAVAAEERHLGEAQRLVKVGVAPSFDEAQAKTRLALARTQLARAQGDALLARARLAQAIGGADATTLGVTGGWPGPEAGEDGPLDALVSEAIAHRPDAAAALLALRSADAAIDIAEQGKNPTLSLGADLGAQATEDGVGAGWSATLAFKLPLLDGGLMQAQIDEARASRRAVDAQQASLLLRVQTDVQAAHVAIHSAKAQLEAATASQDIAKEALRLAEARYAQGLSSGIELADAQSSVVATGADTVSAQWTLAGARASLRAALGRGPRSQ